jgi:hypothetical protein
MLPCCGLVRASTIGSAASPCAAHSGSTRAARGVVAHCGASVGGAGSTRAAVHASAGLSAVHARTTRAACGRAHRAARASRVGHAASLASIRFGARGTGRCARASAILAAAAAAE